jgi:4'-phosphopantetheinyl transferase
MCDEMQVWSAATDVAVDPSTLSADEHTRASQFRFDRDRRRWVAARVLLRRVLGEYLGCAPSNLTFTYSAHGKPMIAGDPVRFNLSHAGDLAVCATSPIAEIGIDVEHIRSIEGIEALFRSISSVREYSAFRLLSPAQRTRAFFETWTVKEACVKAMGTGLTTPLAEIEVPRLGHSQRGITWGPDSWSVFTFIPRPRYVGALAFRTPPGHSVRAEITCRTLHLEP